MLIKFICCDVFTRIACDTVAHSPHIVDLELVPMLAHTEPDKLRKDLQNRIDAACACERKYDLIVLGYGLCGNATVGLTTSLPMVLPRMHDCCTMLCGSRESFHHNFGDLLSMRWRSTGYSERCDLVSTAWSDEYDSYKTSAEYMKYVEDYGEENAQYIWETMHPKIETDEAAYIHIDGFEYSDTLDRFRAELEKEGKKLRLVEGNLSLFRTMVNGPWDEKEYLLVRPGQRVRGIYDLETVFTAE